MFTISGMQAYANVRGYWEDRLKGCALFATVAIPLGPRKTTGGSN